MNRPATLLFSTAGLFISFCGGAQKESDAVQETALVAEAESIKSDSAVPQDAFSGPHDESNQTMPPPGTIRRADLLRILDKGPGTVLGMVETEPYRPNGKFVGFTIVRFTEGSPLAVDLRPGDVLLSVNGLAIVTPDDFYRVFQELKATSEIRFDILRDNMKATLMYPVIE